MQRFVPFQSRHQGKEFKIQATDNVHGWKYNNMHALLTTYYNLRVYYFQFSKDAKDRTETLVPF